MQITKDMTIGTVIAKWPQLAEIFFDFGMGCVGCPHAASETIEMGALKHGIESDELDDLLEKLNGIIGVRFHI